MRRRGTKRWMAVAVCLSLGVAACGDDDDAATTGADTESTEAASGDPIPVGILHSLTGTMSISETAVVDAEMLAIDEINADGGVLGRQLEPIVEDGASDWPTFAEKAEKLLTVDDVAVVFGGWTSASRKAMLPVFEGLDGLLFYPVQYEGLEASPNIFYTGATANQQIIPALDWIVEQGMTSIFLVGSDYVFPRTANQIINAYAAANGLEVLGEEYIPLGETETSTVVSRVAEAQPDIVFNTLNGDTNVSFFTELSARGITAADIPTISVSIAEEEVGGIGVENLVGHYTAWNYYQTTDNPENTAFVEAFKAEYGDDRVTADPIEAAYNGVYIWAAAVEAAGTLEPDEVALAAAGIELDTPEGHVTVHAWNHHVYKSGRIGQINAEGLIDEIWASPEPIEPDPCLESYPFAASLNAGQCDVDHRIDD